MCSGRGSDRHAVFAACRSLRARPTAGRGVGERHIGWIEQPRLRAAVDGLLQSCHIRGARGGPRKGDGGARAFGCRRRRGCLRCRWRGRRGSRRRRGRDRWGARSGGRGAGCSRGAARERRRGEDENARDSGPCVHAATVGAAHRRRRHGSVRVRVQGPSDWRWGWITPRSLVSGQSREVMSDEPVGPGVLRSPRVPFRPP
jgi:hypothetical protein